MIRECRESDAEAMAALFSQSGQAAQWTASGIAELWRSGAGGWVDTEGNRLNGAVIARVAGDEAEILNLAVACEMRRRGVGRRLIAAALREVEAKGARRVYLEVRRSNQGAREFYARLGFAQKGIRRKYYNEPEEDALVLWRTVG